MSLLLEWRGAEVGVTREVVGGWQLGKVTEKLGGVRKFNGVTEKLNVVTDGVGES